MFATLPSNVFMSLPKEQGIQIDSGSYRSDVDIRSIWLVMLSDIMAYLWYASRSIPVKCTVCPLHSKSSLCAAPYDTPYRNHSNSTVQFTRGICRLNAQSFGDRRLNLMNAEPNPGLGQDVNWCSGIKGFSKFRMT